MSKVSARPTLKYEEVSSDCRDTDGLVDSFTSALKSFGLHIIEDPRFDGSDMFGFLISNRKITLKELDEIVED